MKQYDELKCYQGKMYTGMAIGGSHEWVYPDGRWRETKVAPDRWKFSYNSRKERTRSAADNTGAAKGTTYHWYIIADQKAKKLDKDRYQTRMEGVKFKLGHKRPYWKSFSYDYPEQLTYRERVIKILQEALVALEGEEYSRAAELDIEPFFREKQEEDGQKQLSLWDSTESNDGS